MGPEGLCVDALPGAVGGLEQGACRVARAAVLSPEPPASLVLLRAIHLVVLVVVVVVGAELGPEERREAVPEEVGGVVPCLTEQHAVSVCGPGDLKVLVQHEDVAAVLQPARHTELVAPAVRQLVQLRTN